MAAAIRLTLTDAGRAALRNAAGNGTNAVIVATAGVTATSFVSGSPLPAEIKRLATIAGGATAPDTIHVTISDTGTDVYSVRGFGLYLADGTLLGSYGQDGVIVEKSAQAAMLLAVDIQFADIDATQITFGDTNFSNPSATTERMGVAELATDAETIAGTDAARTITPKGLLAALNARLGAGAPSDFVKTLLTKATVLAFITALGIRSAAQYDTGAGKGLDADKLDGKDGSFYQSWANLTGVPSSFPPENHEHSASDITSGVLPVPRGGTGASTLAQGGFLLGNGANPVQVLAPADALAAIGAAAKNHSHPQSDIIGLTDSLSALQTAVDGRVKKAGDTMTGPLFVSPPVGTSATIALNSADTSTNCVLNFQRGGKGRWGIFGSANAETGSNKGGDFAINAYDDAGNYLSQPVSIDRQTGNVRLSFSLSVGQNIVSNSNALVLGTNGAGTVYIRPNGAGTQAGQVSVNSAGSVSTVQGGSYGVIQKYGVHQFWAASASTTDIGIGGSFSSWGIDRSPALQIDAQNNGSAYMVFRVTKWGEKHLAALDVFANGGNSMLAWHIGATQTHAMYQDGSLVANGVITGLGGFNASDRRMKKNIKRRKIQAGIARLVRRIYSSWMWKHNGEFDTGVIAQLLMKFAPQHVREFDTNKRWRGKAVRRYSVDKAGLALECALDADQRVDQLAKENAALLRRIVKLEKRAA